MSEVTEYAIRVRQVREGEAEWWGWCVRPEDDTELADLSDCAVSKVWQHPVNAPWQLDNWVKPDGFGVIEGYQSAKGYESFLKCFAGLDMILIIHPRACVVRPIRLDEMGRTIL